MDRQIGRPLRVPKIVTDQALGIKAIIRRLENMTKDGRHGSNWYSDLKRRDKA